MAADPGLMPDGEVGQVLARLDERTELQGRRIEELFAQVEGLEATSHAMGKDIARLKALPEQVASVQRLFWRLVLAGFAVAAGLVGNLVYFALTRGGG